MSSLEKDCLKILVIRLASGIHTENKVQFVLLAQVDIKKPKTKNRAIIEAFILSNNK